MNNFLQQKSSRFQRRQLGLRMNRTHGGDIIMTPGLRFSLHRLSPLDVLLNSAQQYAP